MIALSLDNEDGPYLLPQKQVLLGDYSNKDDLSGQNYNNLRFKPFKVYMT